MKKIIAVLGGTVALFGLGFLIYVVLFGDAEFQMTEGAKLAGREQIQFPVIILMEILYATLITIIFSRWAQIKTFSTGAKAGLVIGLFIGACFGLDLLATTTLTTVTGVVFWAVTYAIRYAVAGGVIGWLLGRE
ncbi:MAG: hypothetical protein R3250_13825 [Melioribacteraceae bacterium]|nr:hypothetical protein [Melioribacteraceae bacterium]